MSQPLPSAPVAQPSGSRFPVASARRIAIVGAGRLGTVLARELSRVGHDVRGPLARDYTDADAAGREIVLLCVPDREIAGAAANWRRLAGGGEALLGHCSGATGLDVLGPGGPGEAASFSLHPLMTFAAPDVSPQWSGAAAAVAGSSPDALATASALARDLGLRPVAVGESDRAAYHASASIASNFLVTLELAAEELAAGCGVSRAMLVPLVRATVENWAADGAAALTGPIARGDMDTVRRQRDAVAERAPQLLGLFDSLAEATGAAAAGSGALPGAEIAA